MCFFLISVWKCLRMPVAIKTNRGRCELVIESPTWRSVECRAYNIVADTPFHIQRMCYTFLRHIIVFNPLNVKLFSWKCLLTWSYVKLTRSTSSREWKLSRCDKVGVNHFEILLSDFTFFLTYPKARIHIQKLVFNVLIKIEPGPVVKGLKLPWQHIYTDLSVNS